MRRRTSAEDRRDKVTCQVKTQQFNFYPQAIFVSLTYYKYLLETFFMCFLGDQEASHERHAIMLLLRNASERVHYFLFNPQKKHAPFYILSPNKSSLTMTAMREG